jgi:hypothetical protein
MCKKEEAESEAKAVQRRIAARRLPPQLREGREWSASQREREGRGLNLLHFVASKRQTERAAFI